jgi:hypothetical protein
MPASSAVPGVQLTVADLLQRWGSHWPSVTTAATKKRGPDDDSTSCNLENSQHSVSGCACRWHLTQPSHCPSRHVWGDGCMASGGRVPGCTPPQGQAHLPGRCPVPVSTQQLLVVDNRLYGLQFIASWIVSGDWGSNLQDLGIRKPTASTPKVSGALQRCGRCCGSFPLGCPMRRYLRTCTPPRSQCCSQC